MQEDMDLMYLGKKFVDKAHRYIDESLRIYGITMSQFSILMYIRENYANAVSLKDIAEHFDLSHVTVIGILRRMEKNGLIISTTNPEDRRSRHIMLSPKAIKLCDKIVTPHHTISNNMVKVLGKEKVEVFRNTLNDLYSNFDKMANDISGMTKNINQIAKRVNSTDYIYAGDIRQIKEKQEEIWQLLKSTLSKAL